MKATKKSVAALALKLGFRLEHPKECRRYFLDNGAGGGIEFDYLADAEEWLIWVRDRRTASEAARERARTEGRVVWMYSCTDGDSGLYGVALFRTKAAAEQWRDSQPSRGYAQIEEMEVR